MVNHALLAVNAMLPQHSRMLPAADVLVIDEGHALDEALSRQNGIILSRQKSETILNSLLKVDEKGVYKGLLSKAQPLFTSIESLRTEMGQFWDRAVQEIKNRAIINEAFTLKETMHALAGSMRILSGNIRTPSLGLFKEDEEIELKATVAKLTAMADDMDTLAEGSKGYVRWSEMETKKIALRMAPIYPKEFVRTNIIPYYRALILTSATLSVAGDFSLTRKVLGLEGARLISLPSPYDVRSQVSIVIKRDIDLRRLDAGIDKLAIVILEEALNKDGGILVLFTSREIMRRAYESVSKELKRIGVIPMMQGILPSQTMLEKMRGSTNSVIFGLESFWEGVDVKGDSLKSLIITKLPFEVPTEPLLIAREAAIRAGGGTPFHEYSLPKAILKFRQGFGRLIRSKSDTGRVIICDERVVTKTYGYRFMESIY